MEGSSLGHFKIPYHFLKGLRKTKKTSGYSISGLDLNSGPSEYEAECDAKLTNIEINLKYIYVLV